MVAAMTEPEAKRQAVDILRADANDLARYIDGNNGRPGNPTLPRLVEEAIRLRMQHIRAIEAALRGE